MHRPAASYYRREGKWELEWKLDYKDNAVKYPVHQELALKGGTVKVDAVEISPIAVNVKASGEYIKAYDASPHDPCGRRIDPNSKQ